ncbi:MAG: M1 family metallopeptidase [Chloroflexi bacterium]|nr:M1 family metallopeptidase [Chloroflexota bacterium]
MDEIYFRLFPNTANGVAVVEAIQVDGQDAEPVHEFHDSAIRVPLLVALQPGESVDIQMDFEVRVPQVLGGHYGLFGYAGNVLALEEFYPVIPVYDDEGWNVETPSPNGDITYLDSSFYLVRVTAPADLVVVASGVEIGRAYESENQVLTFAAGPVRDFYLAAGDGFTVVSKTVGETTINSYALPKGASKAKFALRVARDALKSFNERLGTYPYTELDIVSTSMMALGMEYPGVVAISRNFYDRSDQGVVSVIPELAGDDGSLFGNNRYQVAEVLPRDMFEMVIAHEVGHQWFYNSVGNDQIDEPWLDESITQYITGLYYLDSDGRFAFKVWLGEMDSRWNRVSREDIPIGLPVRAYTRMEYGAIVYGRGPLFIEALAKEMGQRTFDEFLRDYSESHKWGIGTGDAFRQLAERHCQCDLSALFEEWVYEK